MSCWRGSMKLYRLALPRLSKYAQVGQQSWCYALILHVLCMSILDFHASVWCLISSVSWVWTMPCKINFLWDKDINIEQMRLTQARERLWYHMPLNTLQLSWFICPISVSYTMKYWTICLQFLLLIAFVWISRCSLLPADGLPVSWFPGPFQGPVPKQ